MSNAAVVPTGGGVRADLGDGAAAASLPGLVLGDFGEEDLGLPFSGRGRGPRAVGAQWHGRAPRRAGEGEGGGSFT